MVQILSLSLRQWRNYGSLEIALEGLLHLFVGKNGSGKTNLLDAVSMLSTLSSFLRLDEEDLPQRGTDFYRVSAHIRSDNTEEERLEVTSQFLPRRKKVCSRNDVRMAASDMVGRLPTVVFLPQDLSLFTGPPAERRRFLDSILSQVSPPYYRSLHEYQKLLRQRGSLLRQIADGRADPGDLAPWDHRLSEEGAKIILLRLELIETFSLSLQEELRALGEQWSDVRMAHKRAGSAREEHALAEELAQLYRASREKDILLQQTLVGPHRDDWSMEADGISLPRFASRGQQRAAVLALLMLESSYLELKRGERPVILLDDVFSELDDLHQERLVAAFPQHQVLLTATHLPPNLEGAAVWEVEEGVVVQR